MVARLEEARALIALGRLGAGRQALSRYETRRGGSSPTTKYLWAQIALRESRYHDCLALCAAIDPAAPEYHQGLLLNLECALRMGHLDETQAALEADKSRAFSRIALGLIQTELEGARQPSRGLLTLAVEIALRAGNFDAACRWYERWQAAAGSPRDDQDRPRLVIVDIWKQRVKSGRQRIAKGTLLFHLKEFALAIQCLRLGLETAPRSVQGWRLLGAASNQTGSYREALSAYQRVCVLEPADADAWLEVAEAALRSREYRLALKTLNDAQRLLKDTPRIVFLRGAALFGLRRFPMANRHFDRAIELDSTFGAAWWNKGLCLYQMDRAVDASRACQKARTLDARFWYYSSKVDQPVLPFPLQPESIEIH